MDARYFSNYTKDIMKYINNYIEEKLILNKETKIINHIYQFKDIYWKKDAIYDISINLPFYIYLSEGDKKIKIKISEVKKMKSPFGGFNWHFIEYKIEYNKSKPLISKFLVFTLSSIGIYNLFINNLTKRNAKLKPNIYYINGEFVNTIMQIELDNSKNTINNIYEKNR